MKTPKHHPPIVVTSVGAETYDVEVKAQTITRHRVTVSPAYVRELGVERYPLSRVIHEAFIFLLEREPNTSILTNFELREIERYFPEFPSEIATQLKH